MPRPAAVVPPEVLALNVCPACGNADLTHPIFEPARNHHGPRRWVRRCISCWHENHPDPSTVLTLLPCPATPRGRGVYLLWSGPRVVYVGKSSDMAHRLWEHARGRPRIHFDATSAIPLPDPFLDIYEAALIAAFEPVYNTAMPQRAQWIVPAAYEAVA